MKTIKAVNFLTTCFLVKYINMSHFGCVFSLSPENHILEDVNKCVIALQEKDVDGLDRTAGAIRGRAARVVHVVTSEMDNYEPGVYTEKVLEATKLLTNTGTMQTKCDEPKNSYVKYCQQSAFTSKWIII